MQRLLNRLGVALGVVVVMLVPASPTGAAPSRPEKAPDSLQAVVTKKLLDRADRLPGFATADASDTKVTVLRQGGRTAFGTAILLAPATDGAYPEGWLFDAQRRSGGWSVAFEGEPGYGGQDDLTPSYANGDYRTGMRLPFATGVSWYFTGGPHGSPVWNAIDLAGGDQVVRAARGGTAYTMCRGWIRVVHDRGYATDYYHLWSNINVNGSWVGEGAFLGYTGTDVTCGGSATGRHVHFSLRQNGSNVPIANHIIGKWTPYNGSAQYQGYALHGSTRVNVGGALYNYGALGFTQGIVDTNGGTTLNKRSGPGTGYAVVGSVADGATVTVACSRNGTSHTGRFGTTSLWNRLTDGTWVSDAYLATGLNGPLNGWC